MRLLKRYANRRLYDSSTSRTVTLEEVAMLLRSGEEIKVIDNISGEDITSKVLGQTFLKLQEPNGNEPLMNFILSALIRESGGGFLTMIKKLIYAGVGFTSISKDEREALLEAIVKLENASDHQKQLINGMTSRGEEQTNRIFDNVVDKVKTVTHDLQSTLQQALDPVERKKKIDDLNTQVDALLSFITGPKKDESDNNADK